VKPTTPAKIQRIGVIGGGQLASMMADAAKSLPVELIVQTPHKTDPAVQNSADAILAPIDDAIATAGLATRCDIITFENEFINLDALKPLEQQGICFRPNLAALAPLLDKYDQRCYLRDIGIPVPQFFTLESWQQNAVSPIFPLVIKARRLGYDGMGTFIIKDRDGLDSALQKLANTPALVEEFIGFERELAVIAARSTTGEIVVYPPVETQQENQVCRWVLAPAEIDPATKTEIEAIARSLLTNLQAIGVFGIELFLTSTGKVLVNEVSPRTHNSGHYTIEACPTSQFEQHLRAICGLPLGKVDLLKPAVMVNLLGYEHSKTDYREKRQKLAEIPHTYVHWYGKTESRPGRKLGHVTSLLEPDSIVEMRLTDASTLRSQALTVIDKINKIWY
jgi:5-(carboxyamino)imidazole ribonucleotide synthase